MINTDIKHFTPPVDTHIASYKFSRFSKNLEFRENFIILTLNVAVIYSLMLKSSKYPPSHCLICILCVRKAFNTNFLTLPAMVITISRTNKT